MLIPADNIAFLNPHDLQALWLTVKLAGTTTLFLLLLATPLAWWLTQSRSALRLPIQAIVALPLVLPPTVIGFYLLIAFSRGGVIGDSWLQMTGHTLAFSFEGLVIGSLVYSLPFVVQPLQVAFSKIHSHHLESATLLGAGPWERFRTIVLPLSRQGYISATVLGFAHTVGEFGLVLMIGGSIPGETQVASIRLFELAESMQYAQAHVMAGILLFLSFLTLLLAYRNQPKWHISK
jgi:molybdate transport system permease protein